MEGCDQGMREECQEMRRVKAGKGTEEDCK